MIRSVGVWRLLSAIYAGAILWSACLPRAAGQETAAALSAARNLLHVPLYTGLALLLSRALPARGGRGAAAWAQSAKVLVAAGACAILDEGLQGLAAGRSSSAGDLLLDLAGASAALVLIQLNARSEARA